MPNLTPTREAEIRARVEAATPGPWVTFRQKTGVGVYSDTETYNGSARNICYKGVNDGRNRCDATYVPNLEFIAHARADIPALLDEIDRLREDRKTEVLGFQNLLEKAEATPARRGEMLRECLPRIQVASSTCALESTRREIKDLALNARIARLKGWTDIRDGEIGELYTQDGRHTKHVLSEHKNGYPPKSEMRDVIPDFISDKAATWDALIEVTHTRPVWLKPAELFDILYGYCTAEAVWLGWCEWKDAEALAATGRALRPFETD